MKNYTECEICHKKNRPYYSAYNYSPSGESYDYSTTNYYSSDVLVCKKCYNIKKEEEIKVPVHIPDDKRKHYLIEYLKRKINEKTNN